MNNFPGCFSAASVFLHDSEVCRECMAFSPCADASFKVLEAIKGRVDVTELLKKHEAAHKASDQPDNEINDSPVGIGGRNNFDTDSKILASVSDDTGLPLLSTIKVDDISIPPRFHNTGSAAPFNTSGTYSKEETQALQQRQMDDLIYLSKIKRQRTMHKKYEGIFTPDGQLDMALAATFISEKAWSIEQKACQLLNLNEIEQLQCRALASKKINDRWRNSQKHAAKIETKLEAIADREESFRQYINDFTMLAQAIYLCDGWATNTLLLVYSWLTGKKPISRQAIKAKITRLEKRLN